MLLPLQNFSLVSEADREKISNDYIIDAYPLSALQAGMIFENDYNNNYSLYHDVFSFWLKENLILSFLN